MLKKILLVLMVVLVMTSCGKKEEKQEEVPVQTEEKQETQTEEVKYSDEIEQNKSWTFDGGEYLNVNEENCNKEIPVTDKGATLSYNSLHLVGGHTYRLSFDIFGNGTFNINVSVRDVNDNVLANQNITIGETSNNQVLEFTCNGGESWDYKIVFSFPGGQYYHVYLNNLFIKDLNNETYSIKTNHLGYTVNQVKQAVFPGSMGDAFYVINADTNELVYRGIIGNTKEEKDTKEWNSKGYFTINTPGNYYLISETGSESRVFTVSNDIYKDVLKDALNLFYLQRCGSDLSEEKAGSLAHTACHNQPAQIYSTDDKIDVSGGWHDAGDYGRYVKTGAEALVNLLLAAYVNPTAFNQKDILEECKYELDWFLKLQKSDGAIYNKVTTRVFAEMIMPQDDTADLYVLQAATSSTASAAGAFALGSIVFKGIDDDYSKKLEDAAIKSIGFLDSQPENVYISNPQGFATGDYPVTNDSVYRCFAYSTGYALTHNSDYLDKAIAYGKDLSFSDNGENTLKYLGYYVMLKDNNLPKDTYDYCLQELTNVRSGALSKIHENNYPYTLSQYSNSNKAQLDKINISFLLNDISPNEINRGTGEVALGYIFGNNVLNRTYVTGYGLNYPHNLHHRELKVLGAEPKGLLAPGPMEYLTEGNASNYFSQDDPVARRYVDAFDAYFCNEPSIMSNGPLVLALSFMAK